MTISFTCFTCGMYLLNNAFIINFLIFQERPTFANNINNAQEPFFIRNSIDACRGIHL